MILVIPGTSHTGKTIPAQQLLEKTGWPCLSMDHLKMGLIRSGITDLTPQDDDKLTDFLWLILHDIQDLWLVMTPDYIQTQTGDIKAYGCDIEQRLDTHIDSGRNPRTWQIRF